MHMYMHIQLCSKKFVQFQQNLVFIVQLYNAQEHVPSIVLQKFAQFSHILHFIVQLYNVDVHVYSVVLQNSSNLNRI